MYFEYGETEISYLRKKDKRLAEVIDRIGFIKRETDVDLFSSVIHHIIGQQNRPLVLYVFCQKYCKRRGENYMKLKKRDQYAVPIVKQAQISFQ